MTFYTFTGASTGPLDLDIRIANGRGNLSLVRIGPNHKRTSIISGSGVNSATGQDAGPPDIPLFVGVGNKRRYALRFDDLSPFSKALKIEVSITQNGAPLACFDLGSNPVAPKNGFYTLEYDKHGIVHVVDFQVLP